MDKQEFHARAMLAAMQANRRCYSAATSDQIARCALRDANALTAEWEKSQPTAGGEPKAAQSIGGYMSIDPETAVKAKWEEIQSITKPEHRASTRPKTERPRVTRKQIREFWRDHVKGDIFDSRVDLLCRLVGAESEEA